MLIRKLHIQNFRRFDHLNLSFEDDLTVLVARNGHGKTSILDAITVLLGPFVGAFDLGRSRGFAAADARQELNQDTKTFRLSSHWPIRVEGTVAFPLTNSNELSQDLQDHQIARQLAGYKGSTTVGEVVTLRRYGQILRDNINSSVDNILPVLAYYGNGRLWKTSKNLSRKKVLTENRSIGYEDCFSSSSNYLQVQQWMAKATLLKLQQNDPLLMPHVVMMTSRLEAIQQAVDEVLREEGWSAFGYYLGFEELAMQHNELGLLPVSQLSDGIRSVVALVADLAFRCVRLNSFYGNYAPEETNGIVLIDEIEQHLHPGWQQRILQAIRRAFPKIQFIVTTHSPEVLSTVNSQQIRILQDGKCFAAPPGALGAESHRLLHDVLGLKDPRPPIPAVDELKEYLALVDQEQWDSNRAKELRTILDTRYQGYEPSLLEADLHIENRMWEREMP
ncbi:MAG: AAA family ATPase [Synechococcaceae cyanobacterium ELA739]